MATVVRCQHDEGLQGFICIRSDFRELLILDVSQVILNGPESAVQVAEFPEHERRKQNHQAVPQPRWHSGAYYHASRANFSTKGHRKVRRSQACIDLIKRHEDERGFRAGRCFRLIAYKCPAGIWSIGWGHTRGVFPGMRITEAQAELFLLEDVARVERDLTGLLGRIRVEQGQWDALVSLCYNLRGGPAALPSAAPKLWTALQAGDRQAAAREFLDMDRATMPNGQRVQLAGLTERRQAEAALFLS
jgi:lysozyme